jgi:AcrR family transcriptional regulator
MLCRARVGAEVVPPDSVKGSSGSPAEDDERARLVSAFARAVADHGYRELRIEDVSRGARLPQARFEAHFGSKEEGLIAAQDVFLDRLWLEVRAACESSVEWPAKVRAALHCVIDSLVEASALARVLTVEATGASLAAAERHYATLERFASLLRDGREHYPRAAPLPALAERMLIGGLDSIFRERLLAEEPTALRPLEPALAQLLLAPYLGEAEARRVAGS